MEVIQTLLIMLDFMVIIFLLMALYIGRGVELGPNSKRLSLILVEAIAATVIEMIWFTPTTALGGIVISYTWDLLSVGVIYLLNAYLLTEIKVIRTKKGERIYTAILSPFIILTIIDPITHFFIQVKDDGEILSGPYASFSIVFSLAIGVFIFFSSLIAIRKEKGVDERAHKNALFCMESISLITIISAVGYGVIPNYYTSMMGLSLGIVYLFLRKVEQYTAEKEAKAAEMMAELKSAKKIQKSLIPHEFPAFPEKTEFEISAAVFPCSEVGGDFYDFYMPDDDHLVITVGDVSGHGMPAALFMAVSKSLIKNCYSAEKTAGEILKAANDKISGDNSTSSFVTVWYAILELSTGKMQCANAGHEMPVIKRKDGDFELYEDRPHDVMMGVLPGSPYRSYDIQLEPGDGVFIYTDGIPEARDNKDNMMRLEGMLEQMNNFTIATGQEIIEKTRNAVEVFENGAIQSDDITMLYLEYKGA